MRRETDGDWGAMVAKEVISARVCVRDRRVNYKISGMVACVDDVYVTKNVAAIHNRLDYSRWVKKESVNLEW